MLFVLDGMMNNATQIKHIFMTQNKFYLKHEGREINIYPVRSFSKLLLDLIGYSFVYNSGNIPVFFKDSGNG